MDYLQDYSDAKLVIRTVLSNATSSDCLIARGGKVARANVMKCV